MLLVIRKLVAILLYTSVIIFVSSAHANPITVNGVTVESNLPQAARGVFYSYQITASPSNTYSYSSLTGSLPQGFTLSSTGVVSGVYCGPNVNGTNKFGMTVTGASPSVTAIFSSTSMQLNMTKGPASATGCNPTMTGTTPDGVVGVPYTGGQITATPPAGSTETFTYSLTAGSLPPGLTLNPATGAITGTPTVSGGPFTFTVTATGSNGSTQTGSYSISTIAPAGSVVLGPSSLPDGTVGTAYSQTFTSSGGSGTYSYSSIGSLPAGLTLDPTTGVLSGTPTIAGTWTFSVKTTDTSSTPITDTNTYTVSVGDTGSVVLGPSVIANGNVGSSYSQTFTSLGGTGPYTYSYSGTLPPGTSLNATTGVLSGNPTTAGTYNFTITTTDSTTGTHLTDSNPYAITISAPLSTVVLGPSTLPTPVISQPYNQTVSGTGGVGPYTYQVAEGSLPAGLSLNTVTGEITGTPTASGPYTFKISATDSNGLQGVQVYNGTIADGLGITTSSLPAPTMGTAYSQTIQTSGGVGPIVFAITAGALPAGLALDKSTGIISGVPSTAGCHTFTVTATDANSSTSVKTYNFCISRPDPSKDINVRGIISSQARSAYRFIRGQEAIIQAHLERLHDDEHDECEDEFDVNAPPVVRDFCLTFDNGLRTSSAQRPESTQERVVQDLKQLSNPLGDNNSSTNTNSANYVSSSRHQSYNDSRDNQTSDALGLDSKYREFTALAPEKADVNGSNSILYSKEDKMKRGSNNPDGNIPRIRGNATKINVWTAGQVEFGRYDNQGRLLNEKFNIGGIATGIDFRVTPKLKVGVSFGYGNDYANINYNNAYSQASNFSGALYGSYKIVPGIFLDGTAGYGNLNYNTGRLAGDGISWLNGNRGGYAFFEALYLTAEKRYGAFKIAPYVGVAASQIQLGQYSETGNYNWALSYLAARTGTVDAIAGLRSSYDYILNNGFTLTPNIRTQFQKFFTGSVSQFMSYTQDPTLSYNYTDLGQLHWLFMATAGMQVTGKDGIQAGVDFITSTAGARYQTNGVRANIRVPF